MRTRAWRDPMSGPEKVGGREVVEGQKRGLYVYDPEAVPRDEKGWQVHAVRLDDGSPVCGSPRSRGRGFCESPFHYPNGRCNKHGGGSPKGAASGTFKDGRHSRYAKMPQHLREKYEAGLDDPELTHRRGQIAIDLFGLAFMRVVVKSDPLTAEDPERLVALVAPVLQSYVDGEPPSQIPSGR